MHAPDTTPQAPDIVAVFDEWHDADEAVVRLCMFDFPGYGIGLSARTPAGPFVMEVTGGRRKGVAVAIIRSCGGRVTTAA